VPLSQVLHSARGERTVVEQISNHVTFRWFVRLAMDDPAWDHATLSKNRDQLPEHDVLALLFNDKVEQACRREPLNGEHFSSDGLCIWRGWSIKDCAKGPPR